MFHAFFRTFRQLGDPAFRGLVARGIGLAIGAMVCLWMLAWFLLHETTLFEIGWLEGLIDIGGFAAVLVLTVLLFPAFATLSLSFFLEDVLAAIERRDYPNLPTPRSQGFVEILVMTAKFTGILIVLNLLVLPLYIPTLIFGSAAVDAAAFGLSPAPHLLLLAATLCVALVLAPWAAAAALRLALE